MANLFDRNFYGELPTPRGSFLRIDNSEPLQAEELQTSKIDIDTILSIQSLGMTICGSARTRLRSGDKKHGFSMLENSDTQEDEFYDGSSEEYMSFRVAKVHYDQWKMLVRFRQNELSEEKSTTSYIDDYHFDWLRNGNNMAFNSVRSVEIMDIEDRGITTIETINDFHALTSEEGMGLRDRMIVHSDKVAMAAIGKQFEK